MRRIPELDAVRGVAAVVILIYHLRLLKVVPALGSAVDLFFVLSGFLITAILLRDLDRPKMLRGFFIRRALRIWPIYYIAIGGILVINRMAIQPHPTPGLPYFLTYTQFIHNYWGANTPTFPLMSVHTWSLAVEEQFYTLWPFAVVLFRRRIGLAIAPLLVLGIVMRARGYSGGLLLTHSDGLLLGAWLATREGDLPKWRRGFIALMAASLSLPLWQGPVVASLATLLPGVDWPRMAHAIAPTRIGLTFLGLVGWLLCDAGRPWLKPLRHPKLIELGQISYGLYLYHPLVFTAVTTVYLRLGLKNTIWQESIWLDILRVSLSFGLATLSWRRIEQPILRWKDRLAPREPSILHGPHRRRVAVVADQASERPDAR